MQKLYFLVFCVLACLAANLLGAKATPLTCLTTPIPCVPRISTVAAVTSSDLSDPIYASFYLVSYGNGTTVTLGDGAAGLFVYDATCSSGSPDGGLVLGDVHGLCFDRQNFNGDTRQYGLFRHSVYDHADSVSASDATATLKNAFSAAQKVGLAEIHTSGISLNVAPGSGLNPNLIIPQGMSLSCDAVPGQQYKNADYRDLTGTLWTGHGGTIITDTSTTVPGVGTTIHNCVILPQWYGNPSLASAFGGVTTINFGSSQAYADLDAIRRNMILAGDVGFSCTQDSVKPHDLLILGFDNAVSMNGCAHLGLKNVWVDGDVGFYGTSGGGQTDFEDTDVEPFLTRQAYASNEEWWTITGVAASSTLNPAGGPECHVTVTKNSSPQLSHIHNSSTWNTLGLTPQSTAAANDPVGYPVWIANLAASSGGPGHGCNGRWAISGLTISGSGASSTAQFDLVGSSFGTVSSTGQWNANSNVIYVRSGFANISVGQTVSSAGAGFPSGTVTVVGVLPRTKGPDPNDSFIGGVVISARTTSASGGGNLDVPANDVSLSFTNPTASLSTCDGIQGTCLFLNAAERSYSGNSLSGAGLATSTIPSSNGSQLAAGYFFNGVSGPRGINSFSYGHQYGYILKDSNSASLTQEAGGDNGELDDPNNCFSVHSETRINRPF